MAFRIHDSAVRGEVDNRVKGIGRGRIWVEGRVEPVVLELKDHAHSDLAGCLLTFTNPLQRIPHRELASLNMIQRDSIGDLTASRKVRVMEIPTPEAYLMKKRRKPEHMANCLYLEWFSEQNGRVVIESADYELTISAPEWRLTLEVEAERARQATAGMTELMRTLTQAMEQQRRGQKDPETEWDKHDFEKFMKVSNARTDKYLELLDKCGDSEATEEKIAKEMGWEDSNLTDDDEGMSISEMNAICAAAANEPPPVPEPHREGIDWIRTEDGDLRHPLQHRCFESVMKLWHEADDLGLKNSEDAGLRQFIFEFQTTAVKLAGALNGIAEDRDKVDPAFTVARVKRAGSLAAVAGRARSHRAEKDLAGVDGRRRAPGAV